MTKEEIIHQLEFLEPAGYTRRGDSMIWLLDQSYTDLVKRARSIVFPQPERQAWYDNSRFHVYYFRMHLQTKLIWPGLMEAWGDLEYHAKHITQEHKYLVDTLTRELEIAQDSVGNTLLQL